MALRSILIGMYNIINLVLACFAVACCCLVRNIWAKSEMNVQVPHLIKTVTPLMLPLVSKKLIKYIFFLFNTL